MARILKTTDREKIKIDDIMVEISPLSYHQKIEIQELSISGDFKKMNEAAFKVLQYGIKSVHGIEDSEGNTYQVQLENGILTPDTVEELLNMDLSQKLVDVASHYVSGIPKEFIDPSTGDKLKGVEFVKKPSRARNKK